MIFRRCFPIILLSALLLRVNVINAASLPIPSPEEHASFLVEPWKAGAPIVVIFTDPFCPYCIQALQRKDELKPYNTFLFWYPIFGESSNLRVAEIFQCESVASELVTSAVIAKKSPGCTARINENLMRLNKAMYEAYAPQGVPSYYFGGAPVSVVELKAWRQSVVNITPSVSIDWPRYELNRLDTQSASLSKVIVLLPPKYKKVEQLVATLKNNANYDWYLFNDGKSNSYKKTCQYLVGKCEREIVKKYQSATKEMKLLYGVDGMFEPIIVLNGKILSENEKVKYFYALKDVM